VYTLKDYAYQSTPDTPIDAGDDGSVGIAPSNLSNHYKVFATDNRVIVERIDGETAGAQVRIFNLSGQEVTSRAMTGNRIELSMESPNGIYLVKVSDQKKNYVKKIYIR
jgi:phosphosulfolactate phosphohydrolase-like enzyme